MVASIAALAPGMWWVVASGLALTGGDVLFRLYLGDHANTRLLAGLFLYALGMMAMVMSFHHQNIAVATLAAVIVNIVTIAVVSAWYFGDTITSAQYIGFLLGFCALVLLR